MVKTKSNDKFGSGGKKSSIGKKHSSAHSSTRSINSSSYDICSCSITTNGGCCFKTNGSHHFPSSSSSVTSPEKLDDEAKAAAAGSSSLMITKKRKTFLKLTPFTLYMVNKPPFLLSYNVPHLPQFVPPRSRGNVKFRFEKRLQKSDVGSLKRVILPKLPTEKYMPTLLGKEGFFMFMDDMDGEHCWKFKFRYWPNNTSRMYVLENTGDFIDEHDLKQGDHILFYQYCETNEFVVQAKKAKVPTKTSIEYEVQDSSSEVSNDSDDDLSPEAKSPLKKEENGIINYFVYEGGCSSKFTDKLKNTEEDISPYCPLFAPDEGEDGDDDIDKYLCLEGPESSMNSVVNAGNGVLESEEIKQDMKGKGVAHEDEGVSSLLIDNAIKLTNNLLPLEHEVNLKRDMATSSAKVGGNPDNFLLCAPDRVLEEAAFKVDEWGMPYGYETSLTNVPFDFWTTGGF